MLERAALVNVEFGEEDILYARLREKSSAWHRVVPVYSSSLQQGPRVCVGVEVGRVESCVDGCCDLRS